MMNITFDEIPALFTSVGEMFAEKKDELCRMDAKLGDGDLGLTMSKGFVELPQILEQNKEEAQGDIGKLLMKASMKLSSAIPSTMGFLMASGLLEAGKKLREKTELDGFALAVFLDGFAAGIQKRGKCQAGQRTIFDAIQPAATAASNADKTDLQQVIRAAANAAAAGVESTKHMRPVFGKAAVHAAQADGVADQGAVAGYYLLVGMQNYICR